MAKHTGGCLCGAVKYSIDADPLPGLQLLCNCVDCQKQTGTAFPSGIAFPSGSMTLDGTLTTFTMRGGQTGEPVHRRFCGRCGSPILIEKDGTGRMLILAGTMDDKSVFKPVVGLFCEQAPEWVAMPEGIRKLPRYFT
jgi:hypothetical protein